jgi:hypothetical protein
VGKIQLQVSDKPQEGDGIIWIDNDLTNVGDIAMTILRRRDHGIDAIDAGITCRKWRSVKRVSQKTENAEYVSSRRRDMRTVGRRTDKKETEKKGIMGWDCQHSIALDDCPSLERGADAPMPRTDLFDTGEN